jgi:hypothetical protein
LGITFKGTVNEVVELPTGATQGDLWVVSNPAPAHGYVWDEAAGTWVDAGPVQGPQGIQGPQGVQGEQGPAGPSAVSADPDNISVIGSDGLILTTLRAATAATLGGVKVGSGLSVTADGTISTSAVTGFLPLAGGTMTGTINVPNSINAINTASGFNLIGSVSGLTVRSGTTNLMSFGVNTIDSYKPIALPADPTANLHAATKQYVDSMASTYTLPAATETVLGGVKIGSGITVGADGTISASAGSTYTLPNASATVLGGIKIGTGLTIDANGVCTATLAGNYVNKAGDVMNGPLRFSPSTYSSGYNGTDAYVYMDTVLFRCIMPSGKQAYVVDPQTALVQFIGANPQTPFVPSVDNDLTNKKYVDGAITGSTTFLKLAGGTMTGTIVAPTAVNTMTWAGTYNIFGSSGGWAVRSGTTNLLLATTTTVSAAVIFEVKASGAAIRFGSAGPTLTNISGVVSITGNVESTTAAPAAASHLTRKDYVDNNFAPKVAFDAALAEIQSLRTELAAMKAMLPAPAQPVSKSLPPLPPKPTKSTKPPKKGRRR